jgi:EAL and modified HD-GYP domain-containing signal transduction protein
LDDFVYKPQYQPLVNLADIIKIDFRALDAAQRAQYAKRFGGRRQTLLAEKVETHADFEQGLKLGYSYFQGYFFCKPEIIAGKELPAVKANYLRFLQEVNRREVNYDQLEDVIKHELSLSTKLLRYLNSAAMGMRNRLHSIKQALVLLGEKPLRKWASLVATSALGEDKPPELLVTSLTRARFGESLAPVVGYGGRELDLFLMGLFSAMDAMLDQPLDQLIARLPVAEDVSAALLGADTELGRICKLMLALERGETDQLAADLQGLRLSLQDIAERYRQAVVWADQVAV